MSTTNICCSWFWQDSPSIYTKNRLLWMHLPFIKLSRTPCRWSRSTEEHFDQLPRPASVNLDSHALCLGWTSTLLNSWSPAKDVQQKNAARFRTYKGVSDMPGPTPLEWRSLTLPIERLNLTRCGAICRHLHLLHYFQLCLRMHGIETRCRCRCWQVAPKHYSRQHWSKAEWKHRNGTIIEDKLMHSLSENLWARKLRGQMHRATGKCKAELIMLITV